MAKQKVETKLVNSSPIVLVTKKDGSCRFCINYRKLISVTIKDSYSLPNQKDRPKTALTCQSGLFEFNVMPFGLTNTLSSCKCLVEKVLSGLQYVIYLLYLDDTIIKSDTFEEH